MDLGLISPSLLLAVLVAITVGALLKGMDQLITDATQLPVVVADDPLTAVVRGVGKALDDLPLLKRIAVS